MEEIKFKNTSKMNAEEISTFQSFAMKNTIWAMSIAFALLFIGAGVGCCFWNTTMGIVLIVCGVAGGFFFLPYLLKENQKRQNLQILGDNKYLNTFEFYESHLFVSSSATDGPNGREYKEVGTQTVNYEEIYKVASYKDRLFIFLNPQQSFILNFNGMTKGTVDGLISFLQEKGVNVIDKSKVDTMQRKK